MTENLVSSEWLQQRLDTDDLRVVDATYHLPGVPRDARRSFSRRICPARSSSTSMTSVTQRAICRT